MDRIVLEGGVRDTIGEKVREVAQEGPVIIRDPIAWLAIINDGEVEGASDVGIGIR